jgi:prephenate dehydrogenase
MDAETHDRVLSFVSHLPHVVAYALVNAVASQREPDNMLDFAGGGLRDYTRIGASSPDMWTDIFLMNRENVLGSIREFKKALEKIEELIAKEDLRKLKEELDKGVRIKRNMDN